MGEGSPKGTVIIMLDCSHQPAGVVKDPAHVVHGFWAHVGVHPLADHQAVKELWERCVCAWLSILPTPVLLLILIGSFTGWPPYTSHSCGNFLTALALNRT
jgi:hypothetical protein